MRYEDSGSICSYSDYIDELEDEIAKKDTEIEQIKKQASWYLSLSPADKKSFGDLIVELSQAKELIKEMRDALRFYGNPKRWDDRILIDLSDTEATKESDHSGGKRARETLQKHSELLAKINNPLNDTK